jgi:hypothetical protein
VVQRVLAVHVRWYVRHKRLAWASSVAAAVGLFAFWWMLFSLAAAVVIEVVVIGLSLAQWMTTRRGLARL